MKTTYRHFIKILSCSLAIAAVLLCSMYVPVKAVERFYSPEDYISRVVYEDNIEYVYYNFGGDAYFSVKDWATGITTGSYGAIDLHNVSSQQPYLFRIYPLGYTFAPGNPMSDGVIEIADFKSRAVFEIQQCIDFNIQYTYHSDASGDTSFYFLSSVYACFYDVDGKFISQSVSSNHRTDVTLTVDDKNDSYGYNVILEVDMPLEVPDNAVYMAPCILSYLYPPDPSSPHMITEMEASCRDFVLFISKNLLIEQSETLEAIDDQLGDLNSKADDLINGTDDQWNAAQDGSDNLTDFKDEVNANQELEKEWLDDFDESSDILNDNISGFVDGTGFNQLHALVSPVMTWENTGVIMMLLIAFINMSIILFGR